MKLIICGPVGATVGMMIGYGSGLLMFPGDTEVGKITQLFAMPFNIMTGVTIGTWIPTLVCLWKDRNCPTRST